MDLDLEFYLMSFSAILKLNCDWQAVIVRGNLCIQGKPPYKPKSLGNISHTPNRIQTWGVVRGSLCLRPPLFVGEGKYAMCTF